MVRDHRHDTPDPLPPGVELTDEEQRLLGVLSGGTAACEAATTLGWTLQEVGRRTSAVREKYATSSTSAAVRAAARDGLLPDAAPG